MRSSKIPLISTLASMVAIAASNGANRLMSIADGPSTKRRKPGRRKPAPVHRIRSRAYPEQSSRQALRRSRRAQGGPGLVFDTATREWWPRQAGEIGERPAG